MENARKVKIFLSSLVALFLLSFGIVYVVLNSGEEENEDVLGTMNDESILGGLENTYGTPYIISTPAIEAQEGTLYEYFPVIDDVDTEPGMLSMELVEAPDWLFIKDMVVTGFVPYSVNETYEYVVKVSDGVNSSSQKNYILVVE